MRDEWDARSGATSGGPDVRNGVTNGVTKRSVSGRGAGTSSRRPARRRLVGSDDRRFTFIRGGGISDHAM